MNKILFTAAVVLMGCATNTLAAGNAENGKQLSATCAACHGAEGNSADSGDFPRLAGQNADYLESALGQYKSGKRKNPIMAGFAATLKPQDMTDLAAYFSSQKGLELKY